MNVRVILFARARELAGFSEKSLRLPEGACAGDIYKDKALASLRAHRGEMRVAVNEEFALEDRRLGEGDVVAVLPPVSGG